MNLENTIIDYLEDGRFRKEDVYGSFGIWLGLIAGLTSAAILLYFRFNYLTKRLVLQEQQNIS